MFNAKKVEQKQEKHASSNFLLTINPNNSGIDYRDKLDNFTRYILNHFDRYLTPKQEAYGLSLKNNIVKTRVEYSIEQNSLGAFHSHSLIEINQKKGYYHVNLPLLRQDLREEFGYDPHVDIKYFRNNAEAVKAYISKRQK